MAIAGSVQVLGIAVAAHRLDVVERIFSSTKDTSLLDWILQLVVRENVIVASSSRSYKNEVSLVDAAASEKCFCSLTWLSGTQPPHQTLLLGTFKRLLRHHSMLRLPQRPFPRLLSPFRPPKPFLPFRKICRTRGRKNLDGVPNRFRSRGNGDPRVPASRQDFSLPRLRSNRNRNRNRNYCCCGRDFGSCWNREGGRVGTDKSSGSNYCNLEWRREYQTLPRILVPQQPRRSPHPQEHHGQ